MWTLIIIIIVGGLIGWAASKIMGTDPEQGILLNIVVGIVGALLAGFLLSPLLGVESILDEPLNIWAILISLLGAIILLWIVKLVRSKT
jgi:uncharacterized membrane protein YeaQ/YmgE (transglycosylase-associated protein family)